ncbi:MAG: DHH family phosphoesterase [Bacilli bacterium]|nr:DHH family phosphoesterase [Bacilli bacterium]
MRKIVTTYINPDMDGLSIMYAYTEYLRKTGNNANYYFEGSLKKEAEIILDYFNIKLDNIVDISDTDEIIIVDTNSLRELSTRIMKDKIIEIIDHHKQEDWLNDANNINVHIELIGAAATLVAEMFKNNNIDISREAAILLYYGIISNTMNLKIKLTSAKDIEMANWLQSRIPEITEDVTNEIFEKKSMIGDNLREEMEVEFKDQFMNISWSMGQLEIANVDNFLQQYEQSIRNILNQVSKENDVEYISVNCMDVINGYSVIIANDEKVVKLITDATGIKFENLKARVNELLSRKEIVKIIREIYHN